MATYSGKLTNDVVNASTGRSLLPSSVRGRAYESGHAIVTGSDEGGGLGHSIPVTSTTFTGLVIPYTADTWFERIHLIPRTKLKFGNILSLQVEDFEIFNAYRTTVAQMTGITNGLGDGASTPDVSAPSNLHPFTSFLDASSTRLNPVKTQLEIAKDGAPTFDGLYSFTFAEGDVVSLAASGNRIAVWPIKHENEFRETVEFLTDVMESLSGKEQRVALRSEPRESYQLNYRLTEDSRQRAQIHLQGWQSNLWALPMFHNGCRSTAAVAFEDTSVTVDATTNRDFRVGGQAVFWQDEQVVEVVTISAVTATTIEFTSTPIQRAFGANVEIYPARLAYIRNVVSGNRYAINLEQFGINWSIWDNDTGALAASTAAFSSYDSKVLFDKSLMGSGTMKVTHDAKVRFVDNKTGQIKAYSRQSGKHKRGSEKGFWLGSRQDIIECKQVLKSLQGRQKAFYLPTHIADMTLRADFEIADTSIEVTGLEMERFLQPNIQHPRKVLRVVCTDGTIITRDVVSIAKNGDTLDTVTLSSALGVDKTIAEVERIEFLEQVRFDADKFTFRYRRPGQATLVAPVITVYD